MVSVTGVGRSVRLATGVVTGDPWALWLAMLEEMARYHPALNERQFRQLDRVKAARWDRDTLVLVAERRAVGYLTDHFAWYLANVASAVAGERVEVGFEVRR